MNRADKILEFLDGGKRWYKGDMYDDNQYRYCLMGVNNYGLGTGYADERYETQNAMKKVISEQYPDREVYGGMATIAAFNDHPDTDWDDIRAVLEKVSTKLDEVV